MSNEILKLCMGKGFLLDKEMLELLSGLTDTGAKNVIEVLGNLGIEERVINKKLFENHFDKFMEKGTLPPELCEGKNGECKNMKLFEDKEKLKIWQSNFKGISWKDKKGNLLGKRYYYVFKQNELESLIHNKNMIVESFYEKGNWGVVLKKV